MTMFTIKYSKTFTVYINECDSDDEGDKIQPKIMSANNHNFMLLRRDSSQIIDALNGINKHKSYGLIRKNGWAGNCDFCNTRNELFIHSNKYVVIVSCYDCFNMITNSPNITLSINKEIFKAYYHDKSEFIYFIINNEILQYQIVPTINLINNNIKRNNCCQICSLNHQYLDVETCRICLTCKNYITIFKEYMITKFLIISDILNNNIGHEILSKLINVLYDHHLFIKDITINIR